MSNKKHTPGAWKVLGEGRVEAGKQHIADCYGPRIKKANACLIAAAPDLLAALEELATAFYTLSGCAIQPRFEPMMIKTNDAIRKARGQ